MSTNVKQGQSFNTCPLNFDTWNLYNFCYEYCIAVIYECSKINMWQKVRYLSVYILLWILMTSWGQKSNKIMNHYELKISVWYLLQRISFTCVGSHTCLVSEHHPCKLRTFKNISTAPWLKNLVGYSYLLPKYHVKISLEKNGWFLFISLFVKGPFYMQVYGDWHYKGHYNFNT